MTVACVAPLFVPGDKPAILSKAAATAADAIIVDLEDGVAIDRKADARDLLAGELPREVFVRINDIKTRWFEADVAALTSTQIAGVMLPKAESAQDVRTLLAQLPRKMPVLALVETAAGIDKLAEIAGVAQRLAFGSLDFASDIGCAHEREALLYARSRVVLASRIAELPPPLDGVTPEFRDLGICENDTAHAVKMGFGGKLCIHPKQVEIVLGGFRPTDAEIDWARRVLAADDGSQAVDGAMVDAPVRLQAQRMLARAEPARR